MGSMPPEVAAKIAAFFARYPQRQLPKGLILIQAGEDPSGISYLIKGSVRQYDITDKGDEVVVNIFKPPAFFPMSYALNGSPNEYFYEAAEEVIMRQAPIAATLAFIEEHPDVMLDLLRRVYSGVDGLLRRQVVAMGGTAMSRLSFELLVAGKRFGKMLANGRCFVGIKETELATRTGLTRETVSRCLHRLKELDIVSVVRGGVVIKNAALLQREYTGLL